MSVSMMERGIERERFQNQPERTPFHELEPQVKDTVDVAEHEFTHIIAIWGMGGSVAKANTIPDGPQLGVTIPATDLSPKQMQVAAMASADHAGNGSDQMKAYILQFSEGGTTMENAEALAKAIIRSYRKEVLHGAAVYLAFNKSAGEAELRQYLRWAEEDIRQKEAYRDLPIPSWSDELEAKRQEAVSNDRQSREVENNNNSITLITYEDDHTQHFKLQNGEEEIYCTLCNQIDNHLTDCPNAAEERLIFSAIQASEQEAFWRREINGIFAETVE